MRNSIHISLDPTLKGLECTIGDIGLTQGAIIKIFQANKYVYTIYRPNPDAPFNKCLLSSKLCQYNQINEGSAQISVVNGLVPKCKRAQVFVSKIEWQIINNNSQKLENQFLNQINLLWPNASLPLYYDALNCINLKIKCEQLSQLGQNTQLQILTDEDQTKNEINKKAKKETLKFSDIQITDEFMFGNINEVRISKIDAQKLGYNQNSNCFLKYPLSSETNIPAHTYLLNVKEQLQIIKQKNFMVEEVKDQKMPVSIRIIQSQEKSLASNQFCVSYMNLGKRYEVQLSNNIDEKKYKKLQFLLNSVKNFRIVLSVFKKKECQLINDAIKKEFYQNFLKYFTKNQGKICIYQKIPFLFTQNTIGYLTVYQGTQLMADPLFITQSSQLTLPLQTLLQSCIQINNLYFVSDVPAIRKEDLIKLNRLLSYPKNSNGLFKSLYKSNYFKEIDRLVSALKNSSIKHILVTSFANNGKTILHQILNQLEFVSLYIDMHQINDVSLTSGDVNMFLECCFQRWSHQYIFFDNIDAVCSKIDAGDLHRIQERIAAKMIIRKIIGLTKLYHKKCIITAKNDGNLDEELKNYELIKLKNPSFQDRMRVLQHYGKESPEICERISNESESMSFGQFYKFLTTKIKCDSRPDQIGSKYDFSKLAGLKEAKKKITSLIQKPLRYSFVFKNLPVKLSRGILLYGGSGTGKTALGEAMADQFQMKFFSVKGSDILSKYIGGSEAAVREVFQKAMSVAPSIVFFDQFETIVPRRNSSNTGVTDRVVNQFLCYLDGVASIEGVFIVAASSRPDLIDPALLRPGRLDSHLYLEYPTSEQRRQLFELYENSIKFEIQLQQISQMTQGFSYSDIVGLIKQLRIKRSSQLLTEESMVNPQDFKSISQSFFEQTLKTFKISVSQAEQKKQKHSFIKFKTGAPPDISKQKTMLQ